MSRNQFRILVVLNQFLIFGSGLVQEITDRSLPPELQYFLRVERSVLDTQTTSGTPQTDALYWIGKALLFVGLAAAIGLFYGKRWGRSLYLLTWLAALMLTLLTEFYIDTGWTTFVSYLASTTEGMILALVYFSHLKRMFDKPVDEPVGT